MAISITLITTQKLSISPEAVNEADDPTGSFSAHRLTVATTTPAIVGGKILIKEGATSEEARIIRVHSATQVIVEQLENVYTNAARVTFLGASNAGDPIGSTIVKNAVGLSIHASKNKAETFCNQDRADIRAIRDAIEGLPTNQILQDGTVPMLADLNLNDHHLKNARIESLASDPETPSEGRFWRNSATNLLKAVIGGVVEIIATQAWVLMKAVPTGTVLPTFSATAPDYFVLLDGKTIGNAASGAASRANADTQNLYVMLWNNCADEEAPVIGGRGANALADFNANKQLTLPRSNGRALVGLDNMGGTVAGILTAASTGGAKSTVMAGVGGAQTHSLTSAQNGPHNHTVTIMAGSGSARGYTGNGASAAGVSTSSSGSGAPHSNTGPWLALNIMVKL